MPYASDIVGDLFCPGIDTDAWAARNRVPLFPKKENVWILARGNDEGLSKEDLTKSLYDAFSFWFGAGVEILASLEGRARFGDADNVAVLSITPDVPMVRAVAKRREELETIPTISATRVVYVVVSFSYRGGAGDMPWPIYSSRVWGKVTGRCPNDSDWVLLATELPVKDAIPERDAGDVLTDFGGSVSDKLSTPFYTVAAILGILGVAYIIGKLK